MKEPLADRLQRTVTAETFEAIRKDVMDLFPGKDKYQRWRCAFGKEQGKFTIGELAVVERHLGINLHQLLDPRFDLGRAEREHKARKRATEAQTYGMGTHAA